MTLRRQHIASNAKTMNANFMTFNHFGYLSRSIWQQKLEREPKTWIFCVLENMTFNCIWCKDNSQWILVYFIYIKQFKCQIDELNITAEVMLSDMDWNALIQISIKYTHTLTRASYRTQTRSLLHKCTQTRCQCCAQTNAHIDVYHFVSKALHNVRFTLQNRESVGFHSPPHTEQSKKRKTHIDK